MKCTSLHIPTHIRLTVSLAYQCALRHTVLKSDTAAGHVRKPLVNLAKLPSIGKTPRFQNTVDNTSV